MAIKTDMSKAYDRVEWDFLEELFLKLGFDNKWTMWVMACIRSVSFSVLLNGNSYGFIKPTRGIRQGDPMSPFIFILCAEALVHVMNRAEKEKRLTGMRLNKKCPAVQHLLFADDNLFICKANFVEGLEIKRCLKMYGDASDQEINFQKSSITFGKKMEPNMRNLIGEYMGISRQGGAGAYLGLPECFSCSKRKLLAFITDKLKARLSGWFAKSLSLGGKEVLLKSVAMALPIYAMSCFRLTKDQCTKIMSEMSRFWWNSSEDKHKMHWVSWEKMCKPKEDGGLGFRDLSNFNQALLAKQAWRLLSEPKSLISRIYKNRYYAKQSFLEAGEGYRPSYAWRSILHGRELLEKGLMKSIGNGRDTDVWCDKWVFDDDPRRPINLQRDMNVNLRVAELIREDGAWDVPRLQTLIPPADISRICTFPPNIEVDDGFVWAYNRSGCYTVKSGNWLASKPLPGTAVVSPGGVELMKLKAKVWEVKTLPKIRLFMWRALSGALAVADCMNRHGLQVPMSCRVCNICPETVSHVLFNCTAARAVWSNSNLPIHTTGFSTNLCENFGAVFRMLEDISIDEKLRNAIPWFLWGLWKHRNVVMFEGIHGDINVLIKGAVEEAELWWKLQEDERLERKTAQMGSRSLGKYWLKPPVGVVKCNISSSWRNASSMCGGGWILRNHLGDALFHGREAFTPISCRFVAELRCIAWVLRSLKDLHISSCEIWVDSSVAVEAVQNNGKWPRFRVYLDQIMRIVREVPSFTLFVSSSHANSLARDIARSVTRDGRLNSYLSIGGPAWLQSRLYEESRGSFGL